ncbi:Mitochondrial oxaloacetate carrier protein [Gonapodya sp. JEL0774]|nr:Mitochondrial oxaloacetate carrier protein [Gonapodya sp. JEL0774]
MQRLAGSSVAGSLSPPPSVNAVSTAGVKGEREVGTLEGFVYGALAASGAVLVSNPAEVIKTRMQLQGESGQSRAYSSSFNAITTIVRTEGAAALQKGLAPALVYQVTMNGTRLGLYEPVKRAVHNRMFPSSPYLTAVTAGLFCGAVGAFIASPLFLVKARMQAYNSQAQGVGAKVVGAQHSYVSKGFVYSLGHIYRSEGIRGLWRGVDAGMARTAAGSAVQLSTYESLKSSILEAVPNAHPHTAELLSALSTGFIVAAAMNPLDVVYSRMINMKIANAGSGGSARTGFVDGMGPMYRSSLDCLVKTVRHEGPSALWKGYGAHVMRLAPQSFLTLILLEWLRRAAKQF